MWHVITFALFWVVWWEKDARILTINIGLQNSFGAWYISILPFGLLQSKPFVEIVFEVYTALIETWLIGPGGFLENCFHRWNSPLTVVGLGFDKLNFDECSLEFRTFRD